MQILSVDLWGVVLTGVGTFIAVLTSIVLIMRSYSTDLNNKLDKVEFDKHCQNNTKEHDDIKIHVSSKISAKIFDQESEAVRTLFASLKQDIDYTKTFIREQNKINSDIREMLRETTTDLKWIKDKLK